MSDLWVLAPRPNGLGIPGLGEAGVLGEPPDIRGQKHKCRGAPPW